MLYIRNFMMLQPFEYQGFQPIAGLTSSCLQTEVKDHPASLGVTCSQQIEFPQSLLDF